VGGCKAKASSSRPAGLLQNSGRGKFARFWYIYLVLTFAGGCGKLWVGSRFWAPGPGRHWPSAFAKATARQVGGVL
jgi:hypothetical protein